MRHIKQAAWIMLFALAFTACKKNSDTAPFTIEGTWEGKLGTSSATPTGYIGVVIKSNGLLDRLNANGTVAASGTWQLEGSSFKALYTFTSGVVVSMKGTINKAQQTITGTWENSGNAEGTWNTSKKVD